MARTVAVVGGGTGGTLISNLLASKMKENLRAGEVKVVLIGEGFRHYFQPGNLDIAFKGRPPADFSRSELGLLNKDVRFIPDPAAVIDLEDRTITTAGGTKVDYHSLVIATGARACPELIPGLSEGSVNFHTGPAAAQLTWGAVKGLRKGRVGVLIAGVPHKCPPSPDEAVFLLDEYYRHQGVRDDIDITLLTPYPRPYPAEKVSEVVARLFEEKRVSTIPFFNVDSVDPSAKKVFSMEGEECQYDVLIAIPPHRGAKLISESGFGDEEGYVPADRDTMRVKGRDDAFAIGDCTNIPISKSGVVAHLQSKAVACTIASSFGETQEEFEYNGRINCPMEVGDRKAIFVSATYKSPPKEQAPSIVKFAMKRGFGWLYWATLSGHMEWLMGAYFGETSKAVLPRPIAPVQPT
jgi:sulfide:quinone oxidoreductase